MPVSTKGANPFEDTKFNDQNWAILDVVLGVAAELDCTPAQVALTWALHQPGLTGLIIGASRAEQVQPNVAAANIELNADQMARLAAISAPQGTFFSPWLQRLIFGGQTVKG